MATTSKAATSIATENKQELIERSMRRRAVEAVIWGMPAVNFDRMLRAAIDNGGKANQMIYWSQPVNSKNQTLTPNPDTIYLNPFYDTRNGPVVLEIPAAEPDNVIVGSIDRIDFDFLPVVHSGRDVGVAVAFEVGPEYDETLVSIRGKYKVTVGYLAVIFRRRDQVLATFPLV